MPEAGAISPIEVDESRPKVLPEEPPDDQDRTVDPAVSPESRLSVPIAPQIPPGLLETMLARLAFASSAPGATPPVAPAGISPVGPRQQQFAGTFSETGQPPNPQTTPAMQPSAVPGIGAPPATPPMGPSGPTQTGQVPLRQTAPVGRPNEVPAVQPAEASPVTPGEVPAKSTREMPGINLAALSGDPEKMNQLFQTLTGLKQQQADDHRRIQDRIDKAWIENRERMQRAYGDVGAAARNLRPWNAEAERAKAQTPALEQFGSFAAIFGVLAAGAARLPARYAMDSFASALTSIQNRDEKEYTRSFEAWKANMNLAVQYQHMMQQQYQNSFKLMETDMAKGQADLRANAVKYEDQATIAMLNAGMSKEIFELQASRDKATEQMIRTGRLAEDEMEFRRLVMEDPRTHSGDVGKQADARRDARDAIEGKRPRTAEAQLLADFKRHSPEATPYDEVEFLQKVRAALSKSAGHVGPDAAAREEIRKQLIADFVKKNGYAPEGKDLAEINSKAWGRGHLSGATLDKLRGQYDKATALDAEIDRTTNMIRKTWGTTGLGGKIWGPADSIANIFGRKSNETNQIRRNIEIMQLWTQQVVLDHGGRALSIEHKKLNDIIGGLNLGDTSDITVRSFQEIKRLLPVIKEQLKRRIEGTWTPDDSASPETITPASREPSPSPADSAPAWKRGGKEIK